MSDEAIKAAVKEALEAERTKTEQTCKDLREEAKGYRLDLEKVQGEFKVYKADAEKKLQEAAEAVASGKGAEYKELYDALKLSSQQTISELETKVGELTGQVGDVASLNTTIEQYLEAEIEEIPEDKRSSIPKLPTAEKLAWVKEAKKNGLFGELVKKKAPDHKGAGELDFEKNNPWTKEHFNLTKQGQITRDDPALAGKLKKLAGK